MYGESLDIKQEKIERLKELLPEVFTEEKIDWEKLKATLGEDVEFKNERYVLNWAGKSDAFKVLQAPTTATLVPDRNESIDFNNTGNVFIEGENLELKTSEKRKIKCGKAHFDEFEGVEYRQVAKVSDSD